MPSSRDCAAAACRNYAAPVLSLLAGQYASVLLSDVSFKSCYLRCCVAASRLLRSLRSPFSQPAWHWFATPGYGVLWVPALATSPGAERVTASTGMGARTGGAISSQSVTLVVCAATGDSSLVAVTFSSAVSARTGSGADAMG